MKFIIALLLNGDQLPHSSADSLTKFLNIIFTVMGALAFLMIIIAGLRYTVNGGNADTVSAARRQVIYSVVGLIVIALAASLVNFVLVKV